MTHTATAAQEDGARVYIDAACVTQDVPRIGPALDDVVNDDENREYGDEEGADHRRQRAGPSPVSLFLAPLIVNLIFAFVVYFSPALINLKAGKAAMIRVSWSVVILITGVLTYISILQSAGTVEWASASISAIGILALAALLLFDMSDPISALASSLAIIGRGLAWVVAAVPTLLMT